ncbi:hypothetical protein ACFP81_02170 [Deinococcus lacus]|uniref:Uncharacterized protein n=1 Tax=Deinococcus lacus TaxID=392561 RepID=A0ABW1YBW4_9DEIO
MRKSLLTLALAALTAAGAAPLSIHATLTDGESPSAANCKSAAKASQ